MTAPLRPLTGCRVLDLGIITAGASTSALLADLGADVIKVESGSYIDPFRAWDGRASGTDWWNRSRFFRFTNRNKRGACIDLKNASGRALFLRLTAQADVVLENFRRGVLERLGLTFADLEAVNSRIILASITSQGENGPDRAAASYGSTLEATSGLAAMTGYPGGPPVISGIALNYPDQIVSIFGAGMVVAAVMERDRTQRAIRLDISQRELASFLIGEEILAATAYEGQRAEASPIGNADPSVAWQGCLRSGGGDWVAIRVVDAAALTRLTALAGADELAFRRWAAGYQTNRLLEELRGIGVRAAIVADASRVLEAATGSDDLMAFVRDPAGAWAKGFPFQFRKNPMRVDRPAPDMGEHTADVLREMLGLTDDEIASLQRDGAIGALPAT